MPPAAQARTQPVQTDLVRMVLLARGLERRAQQAELSGQPRPGPTRGRGCEAIAVGAAAALEARDRLFASDRYLAAHLTRGLSPEDYLIRCAGGPSSKAARNVLGFVSPAAALVELAVGAALALRLRDSPGVAMVLVPAETYRRGQCDHALRTAVYRRLPLVLVVEGNVDALGGRPPQVVEALEVETIAAAARSVVEAVRAGDGPAALVCDPQSLIRA